LDDLEIILNLWYVADKDGLAYSLRVKPYVVKGTEEEKLKFLQKQAETDYLIAQPFEIPKIFHTEIVKGKIMPVFLVKFLQNNGGPVPITDLFKEAFKKIEAQLPTQTNLTIPKDPLICLTPLMGDDNGNIRPRFNGKQRLY
jgi:hypothetical protein